MPSADLHSRFSLLHLTSSSSSSSSMDPAADPDPFQVVAARVLHSLSSSPHPILSSPWLHSLLDAFLLLYDRFHNLQTVVPDAVDRPLKTLDLLNAVRDGISHLQQASAQADIAASAFPPASRPISDHHLRRARKALADLTILMLDEKDARSVVSSRNRSFGRPSRDRAPHHRSLSWSVSRSWSASRQLQAICANLNPPRTADPSSSAAYTMNCVLLFTVWMLVAAIPCQDRGLHSQLSFPRVFSWAGPMMAMHEKVIDEARSRRGTGGLLREIKGVERTSRLLTEVMEASRGPLWEVDVRGRVAELRAASEELKDGLEVLERKVREVFHKIVRCRAQG